MTDLFAEYLKTSDSGIFPALLLLAGTVCWYLLKNCRTIRDFFDHLYHRRKYTEELLHTIRENQADIRKLMENRLHDREQSLAIRKELSESISAISKKLDEMQRSTDERFRENELKNNKRIRAELKDKISQSYRYYHASGTINSMELEALEDLIEEYESAGGQNSFVHSVVQKEMYTWKR